MRARFTVSLKCKGTEKAVINLPARSDLGRFELPVDWGWFYFITKPLFKPIDDFFHLTGNFGWAILTVTVLIKIVFLPLANKSYDSMTPQVGGHARPALAGQALPTYALN